MTTARELVDLPIAQACARKWQLGREKYGETWAGEQPLVEAHSELVDCLNYLEEHLRRTGEPMRPVVRAVTTALLCIRARVRMPGGPPA